MIPGLLPEINAPGIASGQCVDLWLLMESYSWRIGFGGAKEDRTPDLLRAKQALSQLSYGPVVLLVSFLTFCADQGENLPVRKRAHKQAFNAEMRKSGGSGWI